MLRNEKIVSTDAVQYLTLGKNIAIGKGFVSDGSHYPDIMRAPLHPILIAISYAFLKDLKFAGRFVSIFLQAY